MVRCPPILSASSGTALPPGVPPARTLVSAFTLRPTVVRASARFCRRGSTRASTPHFFSFLGRFAGSRLRAELTEKLRHGVFVAAWMPVWVRAVLASKGHPVRQGGLAKPAHERTQRSLCPCAALCAALPN